MNIRNELKMAQCCYEVGEAKNGYVFGFYNLQNDDYETLIASTPEELGELITEWRRVRTADLVSFLQRRKKIGHRNQGGVTHGGAQD